MPVSGNELLVLILLAALLIGPERLPGYAAQVARAVRALRRMSAGARGRIREELGPEFDDVDWAQFDPRHYDPRRIVREALLDEGEVRGPRAATRPGVSGPEASAGPEVVGPEAPATGEAAPYDDQAT